MSYFTQMAGLAFHNFVSAATGIAHRHRAGARVRAPRGQDDRQLLGRPDARPRSRCCCRSRSSARSVLVWQGVPQNLNAYTAVKTVEGAAQTIAQGPVASQEIIKELGTNGGGFFNANSAHPYENPTPLTDLLEMLAILAGRARRSPTPSASWCATPARAGRCSARCGDPAHRGVVVAYWSEAAGNPDRSPRLGVDPAGGNMEGKEVRFGLANSRSVGGGHHRHLLRRRQQHARQLHAARRLDPAAQHPARRGRVRRRRRRPLRHAARSPCSRCSSPA